MTTPSTASTPSVNSDREEGGAASGISCVVKVSVRVRLGLGLIEQELKSIYRTGCTNNSLGLNREIPGRWVGLNK